MTEGGEQNEMKTQGELSISAIENILLKTSLLQFMKYSSAISNHNMLSVCASLAVSLHACNHRRDGLLEDYGYNMLFVGNWRENCTHHAQLMATSNTVTIKFYCAASSAMRRK